MSHDFSCGSTSKAPTITSEPRGSFTMAERNRSCCSRKIFSRSAIVPRPSSGPPLITIRVGSPPVLESMMLIFFTLRDDSKFWPDAIDCSPNRAAHRFPIRRIQAVFQLELHHGLQSGDFDKYSFVIGKQLRRFYFQRFVSFLVRVARQVVLRAVVL